MPSRLPPAQPQVEPLCVRPRVAAQLLGCHRNTVFEMIADGRLVSFKRGSGPRGARLITMESIKRAAKGDPAPVEAAE